MATTTAPTNGKKLRGTNDAVARAWVDGYSEAEANNMSVSGGWLFSYRATIGRRVLAADGRRVFYVLSFKRYSTTTATKHMAPARHALCHAKATWFYVPNVTGNDAEDHCENAKYLAELVAVTGRSVPRARSNRGGLVYGTLEKVRELMTYRELCGLSALDLDTAHPGVVAEWLAEHYGDACREGYELALAELEKRRLATPAAALDWIGAN